ncbi:cell division GTPase FtsZ [Methanomicrobium sp. W14]|uniref:tubulin/FtsZ family protein n=1 Tax=Methanomicrobium sp. W14 TaxID=2817839 RepID=UPI001AE9108C|nr:tubulin/FtsZ family protein [Methanomicrobium sp. W14]MBP2133092.1 cell division GTPase FtsZ [Methanomicrobium sp. W14]
MRILAIGLGGAGSRIVDQLYYQDRRSSVSCLSSVVIDMDGNFLSQLKNLPDDAKIFFPALDPDVNFDVKSTVDVKEVMSRVKKMDNIDIDAIIIFVGLGGSLGDVIPELTEEVKKSFFEPVFAVCTLPYLREGRAVAKKAADDLDIIKESTDAVILFDNETWYRKIKASFETTLDEHGKPVVKPSPYGKSFPDNPRDIYYMLNERISRQVGLLLRAGEFNEAGLESAEIVLDAGEILNTLKGNGMTAIGYAIEDLPANWLEVFDRWRPETHFSEGSHKRATRIVGLAKQAVYEDISIPCDLTSADKALVLIAGPSKELSMKGFQTVRKWIDSSIAGLEMRSGDYPVRNTRYVGIIIMLSGIHNIPRLEEIKKLREEYLLEKEEHEKAEEYSKVLEEEEMLLLSGKAPVEKTPGTNASENVAGYQAGYYEQTSPQYGNYPGGEYENPVPYQNSESYDEKAVEDEAWELIGGCSSVPPSQPKNSNLPPVIDGNDYYTDRRQNEYPLYNNNKNPENYRFEQNSYENHAEKLEIDDFLENGGGSFEDNNSFGTEEKDSSTSFIELLDDDDSRGFDGAKESENYGSAKSAHFSEAAFEYLSDEDNSGFGEPEDVGNSGHAKSARFSEAAFDYLSDDDDENQENIPLTSSEFVKKDEIDEYNESKTENESLNKKPQVHDDKILIAGKKEKKKDNNGINLPGRSRRSELDMTRMTSVGGGHAPKDTIFGAQEIKGPGIPRERSDVARVGERISIGGSFKHCNDDVFSGKKLSGGSFIRPNDNAFTGGKLSAGSVKKPNDNAFGGSGLSIRPNIRAKEKSLSGGKLSLHPNIKPKDNMEGGRLSVKNQSKKPVELLSGGIKTSSGIKPKEFMSGKVNAGGHGVKPKELLSGGVKVGSSARPNEALSGKLKVSSNPVKPKEALDKKIKVGKNPAPPGAKKDSSFDDGKKDIKKGGIKSGRDDDLYFM